MEVEIGDYSTALFKVLWQGILDLLFNDLPCPEPDVLNKQTSLFPHKNDFWDLGQLKSCCLVFHHFTCSTQSLCISSK